MVYIVKRKKVNQMELEIIKTLMEINEKVSEEIMKKNK